MSFEQWFEQEFGEQPYAHGIDDEGANIATIAHMAWEAGYQQAQSDFYSDGGI